MSDPYDLRSRYDLGPDIAAAPADPSQLPPPWFRPPNERSGASPTPPPSQSPLNLRSSTIAPQPSPAPAPPPPPNPPNMPPPGGPITQRSLPPFQIPGGPGTTPPPPGVTPPGQTTQPGTPPPSTQTSSASTLLNRVFEMMRLNDQKRSEEAKAKARQERTATAIKQLLDQSTPAQGDFLPMAPMMRDPAMMAAYATPRARYAYGGPVGFARGGYPIQYLSSMPGLPMASRSGYARGDFVQDRGVGDGRSDNIHAKLSPGEFVFDAETTALLGNGSSEAGARKLEALRQHIRQHKGRALAKGDYSPDAKNPLAYMRASARRSR